MTTVGCIDSFYPALSLPVLFLRRFYVGHHMQDFLLLQPVAEGLYRPCRAAIAVVALKPALA